MQNQKGYMDTASLGLLFLLALVSQLTLTAK